MRKGKATGPDNITLEEFEALGDFGIEVIKQRLNYSTINANDLLLVVGQSN